MERSEAKFQFLGKCENTEQMICISANGQFHNRLNHAVCFIGSPIFRSNLYINCFVEYMRLTDDNPKINFDIASNYYTYKVYRAKSNSFFYNIRHLHEQFPIRDNFKIKCTVSLSDVCNPVIGNFFAIVQLEIVNKIPPVISELSESSLYDSGTDTPSVPDSDHYQTDEESESGGSSNDHREFELPDFNVDFNRQSRVREDDSGGESFVPSDESFVPSDDE